MKKTLLIFISLILCMGYLHAQERTVKGKVTSVEDKLGLPNVTVYIKGDITHGTVSDLDGNYSIQGINPLDVLVFSYVGFQNQEIIAAQKDIINVELLPNAQQLGEVVVTALGIKRQKREIGYSTQEVKGAELQRSNASNVLSAISGKSAGVQISNSNGVDGGTTRITIRGNNNISEKNQPLIVVDGVPFENEPGMTNIGRGQDWGSAINNINPQDIEDINILKGPTASALYGSRGANGVILITTKRGTKQKGLGIEYNFTHKVIDPYRYREVQNKYGAGSPFTLSEPAFAVDENGTFLYPSANHTDDGPYGLSTAANFGYYGSSLSWGPKMRGQMVKWWDGEMRAYTAQPDNLSIPFNAGITQTHNISLSGGSDMGTMRVSITRTDHTPIIENSNFDQTTINIGSRLNISSKVKADISFSYINYNRLNSPQLGESSSYSKGLLYSWPRSWKGLEAEYYEMQDGSRNTWDGSYPFAYISNNVWWDVYNNNTTLQRNKIIGALSLTYEIAPWLDFVGRFGLDFTANQFETRNKPHDVLGLLNGYYSNELGRDEVVNNEFLFTAHKEKIFGTKISTRLSFGGTQWSRRKYGLKGHSGKWVNPWLYAFANYEANDQIPTEYRYDKDINSLYSFLNLSYDNYLFLELTGRNDWSSSLPTKRNSYFYPSASVSFIVTEAFELNQDWLNFWKLRGAIAQTATDTDPYQLDFTYASGSYGDNQTSTLPSTIPPFELMPQQANSYEFGTTLGLFASKLNLDFTYYYIKSYDQIISSPLPVSSGASNIVINTGILENKGFEVIMDYNIVQSNDFTLTTGLNFSRNRNFVVSLGDEAETYEIANIWGLNGPSITIREGEEFGTIVGYDYVYHENGQPILNEEGTQYMVSENRTAIGNASPDFIAGWHTRLTYKNFTLSTLIDCKWGGDIYNGSYVISLQSGQSPETLLERDGGGLPFTDPEGNTNNVGVVLPGVYEDGTPNDKVVHYYYKYMPNAGGWGHFLSTPGIIENTWVKLRELSLSYRLPEKLIKKQKIFQDLTISLVGRDLFYIYTTLPDRNNPEGINGSGNAQGLEWAAFPGARSFSFGISAKF